MRIKLAALAGALLLSACTVGPDYHTPDTPMPNGYGELPTSPRATPQSAPVPQPADLSRWWEQLNDPELNSLIARAMQANPTLLTAASRVRESREQIIIAGAAGLPQVSASGLAAHLHSNSSIAQKLGTGGGAAGGAPAQGSTDIKFYSVGFDATWEIDVFGGVRRSVEAADADTAAAQWALHDGEVTLTAEIATDYISLRATQIRIATLNDEAKREAGVLNLTAARAHAGFITQLDVNQQVSLLAATQAQIPPLQAQACALEHALAVLLGQQPETLTAELETPNATLPAIPATLPVGLPSDLLRRRPDVREAERKLASATAQIGVATADLYPKFNLIAGASFASNHLSDLLSGSNFGALGLGSIMWPILNGGRIDANIRAKTEEAHQAYYAYQTTVLGAVQNVEDALVRYAADQQSLVARQRAEDTARSSATLAAQQYRVGLVTYVNVLTAQQNALAARDELVQGRQAMAADLAALFKALGGGWSDAPVPDAPPAP
jgi:NodT family efflux transporter outer membrane factor (OMF) lipoprotein